MSKNETSPLWTTQDMSYAVAYYESSHTDVTIKFEFEYLNLTISDKIFIILENYLKKTDKEISKILSISLTTVRTRRSKIKAKQILRQN